MATKKNIGTGHLRQSLQSMRIAISELNKRLDKTEELLQILDQKGSFSYETQDDAVYFLKWIESQKGRGRKIESYEDFDDFVKKIGIPSMQDIITPFIGRKLTYPQLDALAKEVLK